MIERNVLKKFYRDESSQILLNDAPSAAYVLATDSDVRHKYVQARVRSASQECVESATLEGMIHEDHAGELHDRIATFDLTPEQAKRMMQSYVALVAGYFGITAGLAISEVAIYNQLLQREAPVVMSTAVFVGVRVARPALSSIYTYGVGRAWGVNTNVQTFLSILPMVGSVWATQDHAARIASTAIPEVGQLSHGLIARKLSRRLNRCRLRVFPAPIERFLDKMGGTVPSY